MKFLRFTLIILFSLFFLSCENEATEEELNKIRNFTKNAYSDIKPWRVGKDSLEADYTNMSKALDVPISKFQRVQSMVSELPKEQQKEFSRVKVTLDSLNTLDEHYSNRN